MQISKNSHFHWTHPIHYQAIVDGSASKYTAPASKRAMRIGALKHGVAQYKKLTFNKFRDSFILGAGKFSCSLLVKIVLINPF